MPRRRLCRLTDTLLAQRRECVQSGRLQPVHVEFQVSERATNQGQSLGALLAERNLGPNPTFCIFSPLRIRMPNGLNMSRVRIGLLAVAAVLAARTTVAQEIGYLDLTDPLPRERIRSPHSGSGGCGGGAGFTASSEATITLVNLDKGWYLMGEDVTFEVKIQNSGKETIEIPWTPHLGDLEPADATEAYSYVAGTVALNFTDPVSEHSFGIYGNFYGSPALPGSIRELPPGQWALIRARKKIEVFEEWWWNRLKESLPLNVKATASLMLNTVTYFPGQENSSATEKSMCIPLGRKEVAQLDVALWPRESE